MDSEKLLVDRNKTGCGPNVVIFNVPINSLCDEGILERAVAVLDEMSSYSCIPDVNGILGLWLGDLVRVWSGDGGFCVVCGLCFTACGQYHCFLRTQCCGLRLSSLSISCE
ncbi:hypothetical protein Droror1_Dr00026424 [Drosera rotundifolia]